MQPRVEWKYPPHEHMVLNNAITVRTCSVNGVIHQVLQIKTYQKTPSTYSTISCNGATHRVLRTKTYDKTPSPRSTAKSPSAHILVACTASSITSNAPPCKSNHMQPKEHRLHTPPVLARVKKNDKRTEKDDQHTPTDKSGINSLALPRNTARRHLCSAPTARKRGYCSKATSSVYTLPPSSHIKSHSQNVTPSGTRGGYRLQSAGGAVRANSGKND